MTPWQRNLGGFGAVMSEVGGLWRGRSTLTLYIATMLIIGLLTPPTPPYAPHICSARVPMMPGAQGLVLTGGHFSNVADNLNRPGRNRGTSRGEQVSQLVSSAGVVEEPQKKPSSKMRVVLLPRAPESDSIMLEEPGSLVVNRGASTHICLQTSRILSFTPGYP